MPAIIIQAIIAIGISVFPSVTTYYQASDVRIIKEEKQQIDPTIETIIRCESSGKPDAVNLNKNGTKDWGLLQVNDVHRKRMEEMGLNIENPEHSFTFGLLLFKEQGTKPWNSSLKCWNK